MKAQACRTLLRILLRVAPPALVALPVALLAKDVPPLEKGQPPAADIQPLRAQLKVLHDGHERYIAIVPFGEVSGTFYYGDGKSMHAQRVTGGGAEGDKAFACGPVRAAS